MPNRSDHPHGMKLVILGRDGTINRYRDDHVKSPEELERAGWHTVMATNQPGIGRGLIDMASLNAVHLRLNQLLAEKGGRLDAAFFCPHAPEDNCNCRKPLPGLIEQIGERFGVDLKNVHMVGASVRDLQTAHNAGCVPHLVRGDRLAGVDEAQLQEQIALVPGSRVHQDLAAFAETLIHAERRARAQSRGESAEPDTAPGDLG